MFTGIENLLDRIGKKVGLNLASHIKNGKWIFLKFGVAALGGWLLSLAFARLGTKETIGQYQYILSLLTVVSLCSLPGLNTAALEAVAKGREAGVIKAVRLSFLFSLLGVVSLVGLGLYHIFFKDNLLIGETLIIVGLLCPLYYAFNTWNIYYDGKSLFKESALRMIVLYIALNVSLVLGLFLKLNVLGLVLVYLLVNIILFIYYFLEVVRKIKNFSDNDIDFKFGVNSSIQRFVFSLSNNIPPLIISVLFGIESVAIYYIGYYMINAGSSLMGMLGYLYIPALFRGEKLNHKNIIFQNISIGILFWVGFILFLKYFFILMYGAEYVESRQLAFHLSFLIALVPLKIFLTNFFLTGKKNWTIITVVSIANLFALGLFYLVRDYGFSISTVVYLYALELMIITPLFFMYVKGNIDSPFLRSFKTRENV